jgi:hypothetical protein
MAYSEWNLFEGSSMLSAGRYDIELCMLELRFRSGGVYEYKAVPQTFWWGIRQAQSPGRFFKSHIEGKFETVRTGAAAPERNPPSKSSESAARKEPMAGSHDEDDPYVPWVHVRETNYHPPSRSVEPPVVESVTEEQAHELLDAGDYLGALSIYEQLEEDVRKNGSGVHPSEEMVCYFLYNQVVCLCWAGDYLWASRRADKLADYAEEACFSITSYEFDHGAVDCWVVRRIKSYLDGKSPEPDLKLAMGSLQVLHSGASKPVFAGEPARGGGCVLLILGIPAGLTSLIWFC